MEEWIALIDRGVNLSYRSVNLSFTGLMREKNEQKKVTLSRNLNHLNKLLQSLRLIPFIPIAGNTTNPISTACFQVIDKGCFSSLLLLAP